MLQSRTTARRYESIDAFYADPERWMSRERDLGLHWVDTAGATYRAAWIARTEEVYAVRYRTPDGDGGSVEVLGCIRAPCVDRVLAGWSEMCGEPESFEWLRREARRARQARRDGQRRRPPARATHRPAY
jgi:hypothetical protein